MASADGNTPPPTSAMDTAPAMCTSGCGFFGNANTGGMCSKCYKETLAKSSAQTCPAVASSPTTNPVAASASTASPLPSTPAPTPAPTTPAAPAPMAPPMPPVPAPTVAKAEAAAPAVSAASSTNVAESDEPADEPPKKKQVNTNRCWTCNKKIGLLGFQCKCEYYFCSEHRYSDKHECSFDFKALGKQQLTCANPKIAPSKLQAM